MEVMGCTYSQGYRSGDMVLLFHERVFDVKRMASLQTSVTRFQDKHEVNTHKLNIFMTPCSHV